MRFLVTHLSLARSLAVVLGLCLAAPAWAVLYAEYLFEQNAYNGTAGEVKDTSGNGRHGRIVGSPTSVAAGQTNRGLYVPADGGSTTSNALDTGIDLNNLGTAGSITFWFKRYSTDNLYKMLLDATLNSSNRFFLSREGDKATLNDIAASVTMGGSNRDALSLNHIYGADWTYVAMTWADGTGYTFYTRDAACNLIASDTTTGSGALATGVTTLYVGDSRTTATDAITHGSNDSANGTFDTVRLYTTKLSAAETAADCASAMGLDHLEVTAANSSSASGTSVVFTIKACANASCSTPYTNGVTGTISVAGTGVTTTYTTGATFSIANGASSTLETVTLSGSGTATLSLSSVLPQAVNAAPLYCGFGTSATSSGSCSYTVSLPLHHMELTAASNTALTCQPVTYTVKACADGATPCAPYTAGVTGNLSVSGTTVNYPSGAGFSIAVGASTAAVSAHATTTGTATATLTGLSATPTNSPALFCGMGAAAASGGSCGITVSSAGFLLSVPDHAAGSTQSLTISAVRSSDNAQVCTPAFASTTRTVNLKCSYSNPSTGTVPVKVGALALNTLALPTSACDATGKSVPLVFDASGVATTTLLYEDAGRVGLTASYSGMGSEAGLSLTGSKTFVAAPASFAFTSYTPGPIKAGRSFSATIQARNALGLVTPNFGRETAPEGVRLSWTKAYPTGAASSSGTFSGSGTAATLTGFASGSVTASDLKWTEVGTGDITATLGSGSYLGSGRTATGSTGSTGLVGAFVPDHFRLVLTQGCGAFTYSGQPFALTLQARNALNGITANHSGAVSPPLTTSAQLSVTPATTLGSLSVTTVPASSFVAGVATVSTGAFTFTQKLTAPTTLQLTATDATGVTTTASDGAVHNAALVLRSGRLRLTNAFGSERSNLAMPVQLQYWAGQSWALNSLDSCTVLPISAVALDNRKDSKGASSTGWTTSVVAASGSSALLSSGGVANLVLRAPTSSVAGQAATGTVDVGINLGTSSTDASCLPGSPRPSTTGANLPWLRAQFGRTNGCVGAVTYTHDPAARATFGVYAPEHKRMIHLDEAP